MFSSVPWLIGSLGVGVRMGGGGNDRRFFSTDYLPCIYWHARWRYRKAIQVTVVVFRIFRSSAIINSVYQFPVFVDLLNHNGGLNICGGGGGVVCVRWERRGLELVTPNSSQQHLQEPGAAEDFRVSSNRNTKHVSWRPIPLISLWNGRWEGRGGGEGREGEGGRWR